MNWLDGIADIASIVTAVVAAYAYGAYRWTVRDRRLRLEKLLASKENTSDVQLSLQQVAAALTLTEDQVIEAVGQSKKVESFEGVNRTAYWIRTKRNSK